MERPSKNKKGRAEMDHGKMHIYCGDGKGKTTAAVGLAVRCAGSGRRVVFVSFLKDGSSSEVRVLEQIPGIKVLMCPRSFGFTFRMTEQERKDAEEAYRELWNRAVEEVGKEPADLLVLDELMAAYNAGLVDQREVLEFLLEKPEPLEVVLTGREPGEELLALADYVTEMKLRRHPYVDAGLAAREGIEY